MKAVVESTTPLDLSVERVQEIVVRRANEVGILCEIATLLLERDVNILGVSAGVCGEDCVVRLLTDDHRTAWDVLSLNNFAVEEESVVVTALPHRPGTLKQVTKVLAEDGIDIRHLYAAGAKDQDKCLLVLHTSNDEGAVARLAAI